MLIAVTRLYRNRNGSLAKTHLILKDTGLHLRHDIMLMYLFYPCPELGVLGSLKETHSGEQTNCFMTNLFVIEEHTKYSTKSVILRTVKPLI